MFLNTEKKHFLFMHCWLELNVQLKWLNVVVNSVKTAAMPNVGEDGDPTKYLAPSKKMI